MAKKKQEQQEQSQDEHVMAILDKRTNKTAVVSKMNEQDAVSKLYPPTRRTMAASSNWTVPHLWNCSSRISRTSTKIPRVSVSSLYLSSFWKRH